MDFVIMTRKNSQMFLTGPEVIKAVTGRTTTLAEIGSAEMHASVSGNAHFIAEDDQHAIALVKHLLTFLPSNNTKIPRTTSRCRSKASRTRDQRPYPVQPGRTDRHAGRHPPPGRQRRTLRSARHLRAQRHRRLRPCLRRRRRRRRQPADAHGRRARLEPCRQGRPLRATCNVFNIPLVTLVDVPGFLPGVEQERGGIIRHGAKMLHAYASCTTPKITVILRKSYGGSYLAMCSQELGADLVYAWPTAEIAVMGADAAVGILYRKELGEAEDRAKRATELAQEYRDKFASPYEAAANFYITDVIEPCDTRSTISIALRKTLGKRELRPGKKHGNMPL